MIKNVEKNAQNSCYLLIPVLYLRFRNELGLHASPPPHLNNQYDLEDTFSQNRWLFQQCLTISMAPRWEVLSTGK